MSTVAALYVEPAPHGVYTGLPDVDAWDELRDARLYAGPYPVVAHPPCQRWGRYWHGGPSARVRMTKGDDAGCFAAALASVRKWGGVLEHPEASSAWAAFGLAKPPRRGEWVAADAHGWACCVEQGHYGHKARKATWLYAVRTDLPELRWGSSGIQSRPDAGFHSAEERRQARKLPAGAGPERRAARVAWLAKHAEETGKEWCCPERLTKRERVGTPIEFRDLLITLARSVRHG